MYLWPFYHIHLKFISWKSLPLTYCPVTQSFWYFAQNTAVILPCSVQSFRMIAQTQNKFWTNATSWCISDRYPISLKAQISNLDVTVYPPAYWTWSLATAPTHHFNTLRPRQNVWHFADSIFKHIVFNENVWILITSSLKFVPKGPTNKFSALVQIMAWHLPGNKPLSEPMMISLSTHICITRPQWVNSHVFISLAPGRSEWKIYFIKVTFKLILVAHGSGKNCPHSDL